MIVLLLLPVWIVEYVPLTELPIHLMRVYIVEQYAQTPFYQHVFGYNGGIMPNLAIDVVAGALMDHFDPLVVAKLFVSLIILLMAAGCHSLGRSIHGKPTWLAIPAVYFIYNAQLLYGFVNFCFGIGLFLLALATWLNWKRSLESRWLVAAMLLVTLAYVAHLSSYAFLAVSIGFLSLTAVASKRMTWPQILIGLLPLLPPLILHIYFMTGGGELGEIIWSTPYEKLAGLLSPFRSYNAIVDSFVIAASLATVGYLAYRRAFASHARPYFYLAGIFLLLFAISPRVLFTSYSADVRFIPPAILLLTLSADVALHQQLARGLFLMIVGLFTARVVAIAISWVSMSDGMDRHLALGRHIAPNSLVYYARYTDLLTERKQERPLMHAMTYAALEKPMAMSNMPAYPSQQPLYWKSPTLDRDLLSTEDVNLPVDSIAMRYQYVLAYDAKPTLRETIERRYEVVDSVDRSFLFVRRAD